MWISINRESELTLERQIYTHIQKMILNGTLKSGDRLPSTRQLASELSVSRNTVIDAYGQLMAEGYLSAKKGSGTVVADGIRSFDVALTQSQSGSVFDSKSVKKDIIDFCTGMPALEFFPYKQWGKLYKEVCERIPSSAFGYSDTSGVQELKENIAQYLYRTRGLSCNPSQIIITSGSTQGLSLISHVLGENKKTVLVEDPTHTGLRRVITLAGCSVKGIPADYDGLCTEFLIDSKEVSFIYTTPSHQYPLGGVLPIKRRLDLIAYARQNGCYIVEDDYDSEFRYEGQPVSSLFELDPQHVIYLGSFSKVLAPALRLGFMILPEELIYTCRKLKKYTDVHTDALNQYTLATFMKNGSFEKHIWKMKKLYDIRRKTLIHELSVHLPNQFQIMGHATGLHLVVQFENMTFTEETERLLLEKGVQIYRLESYYLEKNQEHDHEIIMGYSHLTHEKIAQGIEMIQQVISQA